MEKDGHFVLFPSRKQTVVREKKGFPIKHHRFVFSCLVIINLLSAAALLKIYQSNQYLNELAAITKNLKSDVDNIATLHRLLLTKLQEVDRRDRLVDDVKTVNSTRDKSRVYPSVRN